MPLLATVFVIMGIPLVVCQQSENDDQCFCKLRGEIDDCKCNVESVDVFNNDLVHPILDSLLKRDYFRYYKVNMFRPCLFADVHVGQCGSRSCAVDECREDQIPAGLKKNRSHGKDKYSQEANTGDEPYVECEKQTEINKLGDLDVDLSEESQEAFKSWNIHDEEQDNFCEIEDEQSPDAVYYDLIRNPERFTGYTGPAAVNVWKLIYDQNCFKPDKQEYGHYLSLEQGLCLEKRTFFRMISGFHTSINVDVTANWLIPAKSAFEQPRWGPNLDEFVKRFDAVATNGEGPNRLKNMYFTYLVEMRALVKAAPYLSHELFYTGNEQEDAEVKLLVSQLLNTLKNFPEHFDEGKLFQGDAQQLKEDFKLHFRNISKIMDCVGCDKCRLWGKVQITGMGTALKILFSGDSMLPDSIVTQQHKKSKIPFQLTRGEIVALINAFGRLSKSIHEIEMFRRMSK